MTDGTTTVDPPKDVFPPELLGSLTDEVCSTAADRLPVVSPVTGTVIAQVPRSHPDDVVAAFNRARAAQPGWAARPVADRAAVLLDFHDLLLKHRDEGLDIVQWETGKARKDALEELLDACAQARYYARDAPPRLLRPRRVRSALPGGDHRQAVPPSQRGGRHHRPVELPLDAGCVRRHPRAPRRQHRGGQARHTDHPDGAVRPSPPARRRAAPRGARTSSRAKGRNLGPTLVGESDYVMFTGFDPGRAPDRRQCGRVGWSGAPSSSAARTPWSYARRRPRPGRRGRGAGVLRDSGELCISMERIYVPADIWDRFVPGSSSGCATFGCRSRSTTPDMGSLISPAQFEAVTAHVDDARQRRDGAGRRPAPTRPGTLRVRADRPAEVTPDMVACRNETFGPVVSLYPDGTTTTRSGGPTTPPTDSTRASGRRTSARARTWSPGSSPGRSTSTRGTPQPGRRPGPHGRHGGLRSRPPARCGGPVEVHGVTDRRGPTDHGVRRTTRVERPQMGRFAYSDHQGHEEARHQVAGAAPKARKRGTLVDAFDFNVVIIGSGFGSPSPRFA